MFDFTLDTQESMLLTDIYKPKATAEFVGLEKPKKLAIALAKKPQLQTYTEP